jgi:hypothetical protein
MSTHWAGWTGGQRVHPLFPQVKWGGRVVHPLSTPCPVHPPGVDILSTPVHPCFRRSRRVDRNVHPSTPHPVAAARPTAAPTTTKDNTMTAAARAQARARFRDHALTRPGDQQQRARIHAAREAFLAAITPTPPQREEAPRDRAQP